jgi:hypothetical protein
VQQPTREEVAAALERVFARSDFAERATPALLQWLSDAWTAVKLWLASLIASLLDLEGTRPVIFWFIVAWLAAALIAALVHIAYTISLAFRGVSRAPRPIESAAAAAAGDDETDPLVWEARARAAAAAGRLRDASLALYHAVILRLDARGTVRFRAGKTPGEYRRETRQTPDVARRFDSFLRIFQPLAFGPRDPSGAAWESLRTAATELDAHA